MTTPTAVSFEWNRNNLILKRGSSSLVITPDKIELLVSENEILSFSEAFRTKALVNRAARRVFESWERKDKELINKVFHEVKK